MQHRERRAIDTHRTMVPSGGVDGDGLGRAKTKTRVVRKPFRRVDASRLYPVGGGRPLGISYMYITCGFDTSKTSLLWDSVNSLFRSRFYVLNSAQSVSQLVFQSRER